MTKEELAQGTHNELGKIESIITDKKTHKDCINKEKMIHYLYKNMRNGCEECDAGNLGIIIQKIENGEFDND